VQVLTTKLFVPPPRAELVSRPRLLERLNTGCQRKLTLICAPAGFGKTTLLAKWIYDTRLPVAWVSLDEGDNEPAQFWTSVLAALERLQHGIGETALALLRAPQPTPIASILTALINDITVTTQSRREEFTPQDGSYVLVLDDYHVIEAKPIHTGLTFLLDHLPPNLHLVIATRADPPLSQARLRARGQLIELRSADLRFTTTEIAAFLNQTMQLNLSGDQIAALEARSEGWITGLQMAGLSMKGRDDIDGFIEAFSGSHHYILDYLMEEVIGRQPEPIQRFLMQTAILKRLSGPLCEAVTGNAGGQETLEKLEEMNLFLLPLDDERVWFRYHRLFADVMTNRLHRFYPDQIPELHLRAAKWFERNNLFAEAIAHALAANDYPMAAEIVESQAMDMLKTGSLATLLGWLNQLPPEIVNLRPRLGVDSAWVYLHMGKLEKIEDCLTTAEKNVDNLDNPGELRGQIAAIRAFAAGRLGDLDRAINQAHVAFELLAKDDLTVRCIVAFALGGVYYVQQDIPRALATLKEASQLGEQAGNIHVAVGALSALGGALEQQGSLAESERAFYQALQLGTGRSGRPLPITAGVHSGLARLRLVQRDLSSARQFALTGLELAEQMVSADNQVYCYLTLTQIEHLEGNPDKARAALEKAKRIAAIHDLWPGAKEQIAAYETSILAAPTSGIDQGSLPYPLTERELEVLQLLAAGLSNRAITEELVVALGTVKAHTAAIYRKLDVNSRTQAVARARELGLING